MVMLYEVHRYRKSQTENVLECGQKRIVFDFCKIGRTTKMHLFLANGKFFYPIIVEKYDPIQGLFHANACVYC